MAVTKSRPLSPHLSVYKMTITMAMSIMHRITGAALYIGTVLLAIWLLAAATSPEAFATVQTLWGSILGRLVLLGYTWALVHHALGGLRHFIWDSGAGFGPERRTFAQLTLVGSILITLALWALGYWVR
ncbi:MAG: succinate dehydrogenase, cytochrome b556 subunit [Hyphomicrobiales bacterium]|jgi:succinate dehydrogenase / fumarate reductase cytochrome b subunit|nr:succinate dehydrogenase, cytochrome b556 subunit [Hyphomicrobiales bacterium]NBR12349.1 succinate dehydrogenase, cytochrome b556 subunit [Alphaproteobacteria bacterium]